MLIVTENYLKTTYKTVYCPVILSFETYTNDGLDALVKGRNIPVLRTKMQYTQCGRNTYAATPTVNNIESISIR